MKKAELQRVRAQLLLLDSQTLLHYRAKEEVNSRWAGFYIAVDTRKGKEGEDMIWVETGKIGCFGHPSYQKGAYMGEEDYLKLKEVLKEVKKGRGRTSVINKGDKVELLHIPANKTSYYGHHVGDIGVVQDVTPDYIIVHVEGRKSTSCFAPSVAWSEEVAFKKAGTKTPFRRNTTWAGPLYNTLDRPIVATPTSAVVGCTVFNSTEIRKAVQKLIKFYEKVHGIPS